MYRRTEIRSLPVRTVRQNYWVEVTQRKSSGERNCTLVHLEAKKTKREPFPSLVFLSNTVDSDSYSLWLLQSVEVWNRFSNTTLDFQSLTSYSPLLLPMSRSLCPSAQVLLSTSLLPSYSPRSNPQVLLLRSFSPCPTPQVTAHALLSGPTP